MIRDSDLEQLGPEFSGDEKAVALNVIGDTVQDGAFAMEFALVNDALQIDPPQDLPGARGNAHDVVRLPDVGVDFTSYPLELIEVFDWPSRLVRDSQAANGPERIGLQEAQVGAAIAHNQLGRIVSQSPPFTFVGNGSLHGEAEAVVNKGFVGSPCQLNQRAAPVRQALTEDLGREIMFLQNGSSRKIDHPQGGPAVQAGAFVKVAIHVDKSLRKGMGVVLVGMEDLVGVGGGGDLSRRQYGTAQGQKREPSAAHALDVSKAGRSILESRVSGLRRAGLRLGSIFERLAVFIAMVNGL